MNTAEISSNNGGSNPASTISSVIAEVESIRNGMISVLRSSGWPGATSNDIKAFIDRLNGFKYDAALEGKIISSKIIEDAIEALKDAHNQLKNELKKYDTSKKRNIFRHAAVNISSSSLSGFLQGCQTTVDASFKVLENELREANNAKIASKTSNETTPAPRSSGPTSTSTPAPKAGPPAADTTSSDQSRTSWEWLDAVKITFNMSDAVSAIPLVGSYLGAVFKAGSTVIEMVETMKGNDEVAKKMEQQFGRLSDMLRRVKNASGEPEAVEAIQMLQSELNNVAANVQTLQAGGRAAKFISGERVAGDFKELQERVQIALQEAQAEATLTSQRILKELYNDSLLDRLGDGTKGAQADSGESARCLRGTRVALLNWIDAWVEDETASERVLWITGSAGRGKSTVASTVAKKWEEQGPCALFHFRRGQNTLDTKLVCSLAKQLATSGDMQLFNAIRTSVQSNKDIAQRPLDEQFTTLLASPLKTYKRKCVLIIVDALDECAAPRYASGFVKMVKQNASSFPPNIKFLLTTRPEYPLLPNLQNPSNLVRNLDLEPNEEVFRDIQQYLHDGFSKIIAERSDIPTTWPAQTTILQLAAMSEGLFRWAQTVLAFIDSRHPITQLQRLLASSGRLVGLDELYGEILVKAVAQAEKSGLSKALLFDVLGTIVAAETPVSLEVIAFLHDAASELKEQGSVTPTDVLRNDVLADVNSLLLIPSITSDPVLLAHTSVRDFLLDGKRRADQSLTSGVELESNHRRLATCCLERMNRLLKQNICELTDVSQPFSEVKSTALSRIPAGLRYCCRAWSFHLMGSGKQLESDAQMSNEVVTFSTRKSLFWLEVMAMLGCLSQAVEMAKDISHWLSTIDFTLDNDSLARLWSDVQRFGSTFAEPISFHPLEIYRSALAACPTDTELLKRFQSLAQIRPLRGLHGSRWSAVVWETAVGSGVLTVAISPDGKLLASGSNSNTIRLWDAHTGSQVGEPLEGHTDSVTSVCFSADGTLLASGSDDKTIQLWNVHTGSQVGAPLEGHTSCVKSVCFSPDGTLLASGSDDKTIRLWDAYTGSQVGSPLEGHTNSVTSVCFSPDGTLLASGSDDKTIRLWDTHTGSQVGSPLEGHTSCSLSVCFSPDGKLLASGSLDATIRLWDAHTGSQVGEPLRGHTGWVRSVCFSPDGKLLASGSDDETIQLWDAHTGSQVGLPLEGHTSFVNSVCFSADGKLVASGSRDETIRLWDAHTGSQVGEPLKGHPCFVNSVCFSPDGTLLASGSNDQTIRLWDAHTGSQVGSPLEGHTSFVNSVCFSPAGKLLASGSLDGTIRLWDAHTGSQVGEPLEGNGGSVKSVCFSADGKLLASGSLDETIRLWDAHTRSQVAGPLKGHTSCVKSVCFSPDGKLLASGSDDKTIRLWDADTGSQVGEPLEGYTGSVSSVCFSPDGKLLASVSDDETIRLWDAYTGSQVGEPLKGDRGSVLSRYFPPPNVLSNAHTQLVTARYPWISLPSGHLLWLPPAYARYVPRECLLSHGTLAFAADKDICIFDVSRVLPSIIAHNY